VRLFERVHLVGSGNYGFNLSNPSDCHVYAISGKAGITLIDAGFGPAGEEIVAALKADSLDPEKVIQVLVTHCHVDHCGGAHFWSDCYGANVVASAHTAAVLRSGDEEARHLREARMAGVFPQDYQLQACAADECAGGDTLDAGDVSFRVISTPGHCRGHIAFYAKISGRHCLFSGDSVFYGGEIMIQNIPDCILADYCQTVLKLSELPVDALLPGHFMLSLQYGHRHLDRSARVVRSLRIPSNVI